MNNNYTDITVLLDNSGSMRGRKEDTIGGFNTFVESQKKVAGTCKLSLVKFATDYNAVYTACDVSTAPTLSNENYEANGGSTRLIDSACRAIDETGKRLAAMKEEDRPGKVIFVIITDGIENDSREFKKADMKSRIETQEKQFNWQFIYMGANQDAIAEAQSYGISAGKSLTYAFSSEGIGESYNSTGRLVACMRSCASSLEMKSVDYSAEDRKKQEEELKPQNQAQEPKKGIRGLFGKK